MDKQQLKVLLTSKKVTDIRKAAKYLQKNIEPEFEELCFAALETQLAKGNSWETIVEMEHAIGINKYKSCTKMIEGIVEKNLEYDTVTTFAAKAYIRLVSNDLSDVSRIKELMTECKYSVGYGLLDAMGHDRMMPNSSDIQLIIRNFWDFYVKREVGLLDPRFGLAAACAGWETTDVKPFLTHCIATGDEQLKVVSERSLKGKYIKYS